MNGTLPSSSSIILSSTKEKNERPTTPSGVLLDNLDYDWYIQVKVRQSANTTGKVELIEANVLSLVEGLRNRLANYDIQQWHQRLLDGSAKPDPTSYTYYWLIGLPNLPSPELKDSKAFLTKWNNDLASKISKGGQDSETLVRAKFIPRKALLDYDFREDTCDPRQQEAVEQKLKRLPLKSGESFKKKANSNPQQVRQQFIQHMMGNQGSTTPKGETTTKLRPLKDILNRLKYDPAYNVDDYVVGYIDRKAGIREVPTSLWAEFREEDLVAYVKNVVEDRIIWDRSSKTDSLSLEPST